MEANVSAPQGTRTGTARRQSGKDTAKKCIKAAFDLLMEGGYEEFSMRNVAEKAGVRLANLQYYFPKKDDLIRALMGYVGDVYYERYEAVFEGVGDDPIERFEAAMDFNLADIGDLDTRHFFIQLWPLLGIADNYKGERLAELYNTQLGRFRGLIMDLCPEASATEVKLRAEAIAAMIEGLMVVVSTANESPENLERLKQIVKRNALQTALG